MAKFKVGDKVRILNVDAIMYGRMYFDNGDITEVVDLFSNGPELKRTAPLSKGADSDSLYISRDEFHAIELVEDSSDKHHDLYEEIEKLKRRVSELEGGKDAVTQRKKSPNESRKEAIEKAKAFVEDVTFNARNKMAIPEFVINEDKRTVVALSRGVNSGQVWGKGIAKCAPVDVFNVHIGKAIALGRAYGLDVSRFEQAPQPTEIAVGQTFKSGVRIHGTVTEIIEKEMLGGTYGIGFRHTYDSGWLGDKQVEIISDSEAQY